MNTFYHLHEYLVVFIYLTITIPIFRFVASWLHYFFWIKSKNRRGAQAAEFFYGYYYSTQLFTLIMFPVSLLYLILH